jgi:protein O-mannosyl-transferase
VTRARRLLVSLALVGLTAIPYAQSLRFGFVTWDDPEYVTRNVQVRRGLTLAGVASAFSTGEIANWQPLVTLSHMLDCQLYGLDPAGHHATNAVIHAANAVVLFLALESMTAAAWPSAWVAALFALHPLQVEAVAWISSRKDVLSALFGFLAVWAYGAYARQGGIARYLLTALLLAASLMSKPMLVTLPALLVLLDYWPLGRLRDVRDVPRMIVEKLPLLLLSAGSIAVTLAVQARAWSVSTVPVLPLGERVTNATMSYVRYLGKVLWPSPLSLLYPHPNLPGGTPWTAWQLATAAVILVVVSALVLRSGRDYAIVGWLWYVVGILPVSGLVPSGFEAMADRFMYVPIVGLLVIVAWGGTELGASGTRARAAVGALAVVVAVAAGARAFVQLGNWRDSITLYESSLRAAPDPPVLHYNLANALHAAGRDEEAIRNYRDAVRIDPTYSEAFNNLGVVLQAEGRLDEATALHREALRLKPGNAQAHNNLGRALELRGRLEDAVREYAEAVRLNPDYVLAHHNLGRVLQARGRIDEAVAQYREALRIDPGFGPSQTGLQSALQMARDSGRPVPQP